MSLSGSTFFTHTDLAKKMEELGEKIPKASLRVERGPLTSSISFDSTPGTIPADFVHQLKLYRKDKRSDRLKFLGYTGAAAAAATLGVAGGFATPKKVEDQRAASDILDRNKHFVYEGAVLAGLAATPFGLNSKKSLPKVLGAGVGLGSLGTLGKGFLTNKDFSRPQQALAIAGTLGTAASPYLIAKAGEHGQRLADEELENEILDSDDTIAGKVRRTARIRNGVGLNRAFPSTRYVPKNDMIKKMFVDSQERTHGEALNKLQGADQQEIYERLKTKMVGHEVETYRSLHNGKYPTASKLLSMTSKIEKQLLSEML